MSLSGTFSTLSRVFKNIESFGIDGFKLWRGKLSTKDSLVKHNLKGLKHPVYLRTNTSDYSTFWQIFLDKQYEYSIDFAPVNIIDCGANIGLASVYFANKYPDAKIIAVEPETSNFEILLLNTKNYPNITCLNNGIWSKNAILEIQNNGLGKWAFTTKEVTYKNADTISAISIPDIMQTHSFSHIDIAKIDIEGSERKVFSENYEQWVTKTRLIVIELHDKMQKDTAKTFFNAIRNTEYDMDIKGENIFCLLNANVSK